MPPETLVIEMNCHEAVGSGQEGEKKIQDYVDEQSQILMERPLMRAATNLSPAYGLSGWAPFEKSGVHIYAWDHLHESYPPFVSVDISSPSPLLQEKKEAIIRSTAQHFKGRENEIVYKTSSEPLAPTWREIAPHIIRQRMAISGILPDDLAMASLQNPEIFNEEMREYMRELSKRLKMKQLSEPLVHSNNSWMHWETSGAMAAWDFNSGNVHVDIYTCKAFNPEDAIAYTREKLKLAGLTFKNY